MTTQLNLYEQNKPCTIEFLKRTARHLIYSHGQCTVDDLRAKAGDAIPTWLDRRVFGAVFADRKMFMCVGYTKTKVKGSHGRPIGIFKINPKWRAEREKFKKDLEGCRES